MIKLRVYRSEDKTFVKMVILPKLIYTFSTILIRVPSDFFAKIDRFILKFIRNHKEPKIPKTVLKKDRIDRLISKLTTKKRQ